MLDYVVVAMLNQFCEVDMPFTSCEEYIVKKEEE
jgi:hypothetical protein